MTTLANLINEVQLNLLGFVLDQENITPLTADVTSSATTMTVGSASEISTGLIEVDEELMWCTSVDTSSNTVSVNVRGMYGTTAAAHTSGALVRNQPRFPRASISRAINDTINSLFPDVFAVSTTTFDYSPAVLTYSLPSDVEVVLSVSWEDIGSSEAWIPVDRYRVNTDANTTAFATGKSIDILDAVIPGSTVNVRYTKVPTTLGSTSTDISSTGLNETVKECLVYGACSRLTGYLEVGRMNDDSAEAGFMDGQPQGQALSAARYYYQMVALAKAEETRRLQSRYPTRPHFTR
jgi:hypothetical protein